MVHFLYAGPIVLFQSPRIPGLAAAAEARGERGDEGVGAEGEEIGGGEGGWRGGEADEVFEALFDVVVVVAVGTGAAEGEKLGFWVRSWLPVGTRKVVVGCISGIGDGEVLGRGERGDILGARVDFYEGN